MVKQSKLVHIYGWTEQQTRAARDISKNFIAILLCTTHVFLHNLGNKLSKGINANISDNNGLGDGGYIKSIF